MLFEKSKRLVGADIGEF